MGGRVGMAISAISTGIGAFGAYQGVQSANQAADFNAQQYQMQADQARARGQFDLTLLRAGNRQNLSALSQQVANSGVEASSASAINLLASQRGMDEKAEQIQRYNTEAEAVGYERQAALSRAGQRNPWAAAGQTLVGGALSINQQYNQYRMYTQQNQRRGNVIINRPRLQELNNQSIFGQSTGFWT